MYVLSQDVEIFLRYLTFQNAYLLSVYKRVTCSITTSSDALKIESTQLDRNEIAYSCCVGIGTAHYLSTPTII